jgi:protein-disulfide isomerase
MNRLTRVLPLVTALITLFALFYFYSIQPPHRAPIDAGDTTHPMHRQLGNPYALLTMIEYGDYECPVALAFEHDIFPYIRSWFINTGLIRYEFRDLPLAELHPGANLAAKTMRCAIAQPANIWGLHARIFQGTGNWEWFADGAEDEKIFEQYAASAGVDVNALRACLNNPATTNTLESQTIANFNRGITGTPTFIFRSPLREDMVLRGNLTKPWVWSVVLLWRLLPLSGTKLLALWAIYTSMRQIIAIIRYWRHKGLSGKETVTQATGP